MLWAHPDRIVSCCDDTKYMLVGGWRTLNNKLPVVTQDNSMSLSEGGILCTICSYMKVQKSLDE